MYQKTGYKEVELKEVGPRFEMRLFQVSFASKVGLFCLCRKEVGPRFEMRLLQVSFASKVGLFCLCRKEVGPPGIILVNNCFFAW
jgi:hypothetical protein